MDIAALDSVKAANDGFELELFHPGTMVNRAYSLPYSARIAPNSEK